MADIHQLPPALYSAHVREALGFQEAALPEPQPHDPVQERVEEIARRQAEAQTRHLEGALANLKQAILGHFSAVANSSLRPNEAFTLLEEKKDDLLQEIELHRTALGLAPFDYAFNIYLGANQVPVQIRYVASVPDLCFIVQLDTSALNTPRKS